jgi:alkylation response protein AidB-like acyl-CoA dehydrogenase
MRFATTATYGDGGWTLNGKKHFISLGNRASLFLVFAQTDPTASLTRGSTCFLVPRSTPGFSNGVVHDKMGERLVNNAELIFEDCHVPEENVVGEIGRGFDVLTTFFPASNAYAAASALGVAQAAYDAALSWTRTRVQGGARLIEHDIIAKDLARMEMLIGAARAYIRGRRAPRMPGGEDWVPTMAARRRSRLGGDVRSSRRHSGTADGDTCGTPASRSSSDGAAWLIRTGRTEPSLLKAATVIRQEAHDGPFDHPSTSGAPSYIFA